MYATLNIWLLFLVLKVTYLNFFLGELENGGNIRLRDHASTMFKSNKLGIVIPFRERFDELLEFVPHIHSFLKNQDVLHEIFVINQVIKLSYSNMIIISLKIFFFIYHSG